MRRRPDELDGRRKITGKVGEWSDRRAEDENRELSKSMGGSAIYPAKHGDFTHNIHSTHSVKIMYLRCKPL